MCEINKFSKSSKTTALHLQNSDILSFGSTSQESHKWCRQHDKKPFEIGNEVEMCYLSWSNPQMVNNYARMSVELEKPE
jgi:hypothetical protein